MATASINGVRLRYEVAGRESVPLVLVHGSWGSHHGWDLVVPGLGESFRVARAPISSAVSSRTSRR